MDDVTALRESTVDRKALIAGLASPLVALAGVLVQPAVLAGGAMGGYAIYRAYQQNLAISAGRLPESERGKVLATGLGGGLGCLAALVTPLLTVVLAFLLLPVLFMILD